MKGKLFINASQVVTPLGLKALKGKSMGDLAIYEDAAICTEGSIIKEVASTKELEEKYGSLDYEKIDLKGHCVIPGFVDSHTHFVFGGYREDEFLMRLKGASYMQIMQAGGGIANTVKSTRTTSEDELYVLGFERLKHMLSMGVTTVEAKSGYGLDLVTELKQLKVQARLQKSFPMDIVNTFLGAHAVPAEYKKHESEYVEYLIHSVLPEVKNQCLAEFCDVFCEEGVFSLELSKKLLLAAVSMGFKLKMHADEMEPMGGSELAVELNAFSADHLLAISTEGIKALAHSSTIATLLPCTAFSLNKEFAPARRMIDAGCAVALATDFNPGSCFTASIPLTIALGVLKMGLTMEEALTALTLNAAAALDRSKTIGSIETGKQANFLVLHYPSYKFLVYNTGMNCVEKVLEKAVASIRIHYMKIPSF